MNSGGRLPHYNITRKISTWLSCSVLPLNIQLVMSKCEEDKYEASQIWSTWMIEMVFLRYFLSLYCTESKAVPRRHFQSVWSYLVMTNENNCRRMITGEFYFTCLFLGIQTVLWSEWRVICLYAIFDIFSYTELS